MDAKYFELVETLVAELMSRYMIYLKSAEDEYDYCTVVTAALVFKELALAEFKKSVLRDSNDDPDEICQIVDHKAQEIAEFIRSRSLNIQQSLN